MERISLLERGVKKCTACETVKPLAEFEGNRKMRMLRGSRCRKCHSKGQSVYYLTAKGKETKERHNRKREYSREYYRKVDRNRALVKQYGITLEEYNSMNSLQHGACAICHDRPVIKGLVVDHDHKAGDVRGLLCNSCNRGLGYFKDDPIRLIHAAKYILDAIEKAAQRDDSRGEICFQTN